MRTAFVLMLSLGLSQAVPATPAHAVFQEGDWVAHDFHFRSGETLPQVHLHYRTVGSPIRDSAGEIVNAVLVLHSTASASDQFQKPQFADVVFGPGQVLDASRYYTVMPDSIGHGRSSKPSDGLKARFPAYDYDDMVGAQHALLTQGLGIRHLELVMGTSMGCMHSWVWAETYPTFMDAVMPLACLPAPIAGRNRMWRKMLIDQIRRDPTWNGGNYSQQPVESLRWAAQLILIASSGAEELQKLGPDAPAADRFLTEFTEHKMAGLDANDLLYALGSSRNYEPSGHLDAIRARLLTINFADDFINPPELNIAGPAVARLPNARLIVVPSSPDTHGHLTHTWAVFWQESLRTLLTQGPP
jgi:homoserine O-acetyltransferase